MNITGNNSRLYARHLTGSGLEDGYVLGLGETRPALTTVLSEPTMFITTAGGAPILDKVTYVTCQYKIINERGFGETLFDQPGRIRGRGNSTWAMPKKPWKVKLDNSVKVLGMPASKDWALLANYIDPSKLRNALSSEISNRTGLPWAPRSVNMEVYLNGQYQGLYQLSESVEVDPARVNIDKIKATDVSGRNLTGGYVMEVDTRMEQNAEIGWRTRLNVPIIFDTPDGTVSQQYNYMKSFTQACEDALFAENFTAGGWMDYLDTASWADWYLLNELVSNNDSGFGASVKLTKPRDPVSGPPSKLFCGPAWDFDASCGITFFIPHPSNAWWTRVGATWIARMLEDPAFRQIIKVRWRSLRSRLLAENDTIFQWLTAQEDAIDTANQRDKQLWGNGTAPDIHSWLGSRIAWLDSEFMNGYSDITAPQTPTGFATTSITQTTVGFVWDDLGVSTGTGVVGYRIRKNGAIAAITAYPYSSPINQITVAGLVANTPYDFTLECRDPAGNWSTATVPLSVTTSA